MNVNEKSSLLNQQVWKEEGSAAVAMIASVLGGFAGYVLGHILLWVLQ